MRMALESAGTVPFHFNARRRKEKHKRRRHFDIFDYCFVEHSVPLVSDFPVCRVSFRFQADQQPVPADHPALHGGRHDYRL